jgi:hypothetical protein
MSTPTEHRFLTREEVGAMLKISPGWLANLAAMRPRRGPKFCKLGSSHRSPARYLASDVFAWAADPAGHEREAWGTAAGKRNKRRQKAGR